VQPPSSTLHQRIHTFVGAAIAGRAIAPGSILLEAVIADALVTSRTPVKAALELLRSDGRVAKGPGRGYIVLEHNGKMPEHRRRLAREHFLALGPADLGGRAPAAWSRIVNEIECEVASASIHGPMRIVETEIAQVFGVSRTVVRDVLSRLDRTGLIAMDGRRRWRVVPLTIDRGRDLYDLRIALEPAALRGAFARGAHADAAEMRARLADARARHPDIRPADLQGLERDLHVDLLGRCGNREIVKALRVGQIQLGANRELFVRLKFDYSKMVDEHLAIFDRLIAGDVEGAVAALITHLSNGRGVLLRGLEALRPAAPRAMPSYLQTD
jgi:DNA-binding GntR family transcriptional regulator